MSDSQFWEKLGSGESDANRRLGGRIRQESVVSNLGPVLDLSSGGARILASSGPRGRMEITFRDAQQQVTVPAEVMWSRRRGLFKREIGVRFIGVSEQEARALAKMTMQNRVERVFHGRAA